MYLFHFEIRNAVTQQPTNTVVLLKHRDVVTSASQLLRSGQACRARAHNGNTFAGFVGVHHRLNPVFCPSTVNDGVFNRLDTNGIVVNVQRASGLAWRWTNAPSELREIVGAVQHINGVFPIALKHQLVEVRNNVVDRAATVTKGRAAIHTARRLLLGTRIVQANYKLFVVFQALFRRQVRLFNTFKIHEPSNFTHDSSPVSRWLH